MPAAPPPPLDTRRPFSRADAIAAGVDPRLLRGRRFRRLFRGVYVDAATPVTPLLLAAAALVPFGATAFASHASAARVHRVPIPTLALEHVTVTDADHRRTRDGIRCHVRADAPAGASPEVMTVGGVRVSSYHRMFVELGEVLSLVDLVAVGDNLVRRGKATTASLIRSCGASGLPGARAALAAARLVRPGVDSVMETRLRLLIVLAGLPEPTVNLTLRDHDGHPVRRYDLAYRVSRTIVEYDGRQHIRREEQWESDLLRRQEIDDSKWRILVVVASGIFEHPERTLSTLHRVLRERGEPGVPAMLAETWRVHFPGRR